MSTSPNPDQTRPHREWECEVNGCPVCMPPLGVMVTLDEKAEFDRLRAENEALKVSVALWERRFDAWQNWRVFESAGMSDVPEVSP